MWLCLLFVGKPASEREFEGAKDGHKNYLRNFTGGKNVAFSLTVIFCRYVYALDTFVCK